MLYNVPGRTGCNIDAATLAKLATIPHVIGVKEASGNIKQMVEICRAVPADFLVLSGDDALTLPLMAIGGRGLISVASNAIPAEMAQMVEAAERGDFAAARQMHQRLVPLMLGNFVESNPGPVKFAMAVMGLCEEVYRLPMVSPRPASQEKIIAFLKELDVLKGVHHEPTTCSVSLQSTIEALAAAGAGADKRGARAAFDELKAALEAGTVRSAEPDHRHPPAGASTPGSSRASCSASGSATSSISRPACRSTTRTRRPCSDSAPSPTSASCRADRRCGAARISAAA